MENPIPRRPCWVEISTGAFQNNFRILQEAAAPVAVLAIVKANAYGHGLSICTRAAVAAGARWLGVTSVEEGVAARAVCDSAGFPDVQILVISGPFRGQGAAAIEARLTPVVWDAWQLEEMTVGASAGEPVSVHLELDTGMNRQGVSPDGLGALLDRLLTLSDQDSRPRLDGVMTHLYAADESDAVTTFEQLVELERMVEQVLEATSARGMRPAWLHVGNSAALLGGDALRELEAICIRHQLLPMARPGLALYGLAPEFEPDKSIRARELAGKLRPVLEWKTQVVSVHSIEAGQVVGYNGTFVATEPMRVALLAVGYADGLNRALSNRGAVLVNGCQAAIVGRISMDQTVIDVTGIADVAVGSEVVLIGRQGNVAITAEDHVRWAGTIAWEIFTSISERVERVPV